MSGAVNKAIILGNLGNDPEVRNLTSGVKIANLSVATTETWRDKNSGERKERTEWHRVVIFNEGLAKIAEQYLRKGSKVYLEGSIQTRKWQDQSGADRYSTEIVLQPFNGTLVLLDGPPEREEQQPRQTYSANKENRRIQAPAFESGGEDDDSIPF